ncbi:putative adaptin ear-binding coat-associated protein 1 [Venustampulla echinocandica]|uniref:Putative adaptin ear-binding coat-associated protein 1 n=1 Tax=Venustampulla echinocandica TaxID=2656787 RepID=A0A370TA26_9HELO|nr:putative adaptin ear-binding coat-associated protein 1 [Venustampulla echinocandica]RDL30481.1 putative adaptin ear-binding coat-associated protein 1 [Venustampulla echinocandica]
MEPSIDPSTGSPLPADAIQRILFIAPTVHVYNIPPLTSTKGYVAASWTADNNKRQIFSARLRVLETAIPKPNNDNEETVKTDILLEDPSNGQLFAAAPYTIPAVVEQVLDSSRFFALRVQGEGGRKAVLGIGFEERSDAFDFSVALQEARKALGIDASSDGGAGGKKASKAKEKVPEKKDFSLKEGETITVNIGGRGRRNPPKKEGSGEASGSFQLPPPPQGGSFLPPPPSAQEVKAQKRLSQNSAPPAPGSMEDLGFDDGEFGEFQ